MRSLGLSLSSKFKRITLFAQKSKSSHTIPKHRILLFLRSYSSNSNFFANGIAKIVLLLEEAKSCVLGTQIHGQILKLGLTSDTYVQNNLMKVYTRYGVLSDGLMVFDEMPNRNLFSWALIISGAVNKGEFELGLDMYFDMTRSGLMANEFVLGSVLKGCAHARARGFGLCIHSFTLKIGMENNPFVGSSLLNFYVRLKDMDMMETVFDCMDCVVDTGCWNSVIGGYTQCGYGIDAVNMFSTMKYEGVKMDNYTFINALQAVGDLNVGAQIHGLIIRNEMETDTSVMNALLDMYNKTGAEQSAFKIFKRIASTDIISWNTVFGSLDSKANVYLFNKLMLTSTRPNHITFSILLRQSGELNLGHQFHCLALKFGFFADLNILSSLINMLSNCGAMEMARSAFDSILSKDVSAWNELVFGYISNGFDIEALQCFCSLWNKSGVEANEYTFSIILEACFQSGKQEMGRQIHGTTIKKGFTCNNGSLIKAYVYFGMLGDCFEFVNGGAMDIKSWGSMISTMVHRGYNREAVHILACMLETGMKPDEYILGSILNRCANVGVYVQTISIHPLILKSGFESQVFVASALVDAYAKCGDIRSARMVFDNSSKLNDVIIYNAMIMGYGHHGDVMKAMQVFEKMKLANLKASQATFVGIICACSHKGLLDEGLYFFELMKSEEYGMEPCPHIYGALVDMFSRSGCLELGKHVIESMPFRPWPAILRSLLTGSTIHRNLQLAEWAARKLRLSLTVGSPREN